MALASSYSVQGGGKMGRADEQSATQKEDSEASVLRHLLGGDVRCPEPARLSPWALTPAPGL